MATPRLLETHLEPADEQIEQIVTNLCRCETHNRVRKAVRRAAELSR